MLGDGPQQSIIFQVQVHVDIKRAAGALEFQLVGAVGVLQGNAGTGRVRRYGARSEIAACGVNDGAGDVGGD